MTEKVPDFSKFAIVFKLQPLQYCIFSPLQQHYSLPFARHSHVYRHSKFVVTFNKWTLRAHFAGPYLQVGNRHSDIGNRLSDRLGLVGRV